MIRGFIGTIGQGKSLSANKYLYKEFLRGKTIFSNIKLNFPHELVTFEMMRDYANSQATFSNAVLFIDEVHIFIDSRRSGSSGNLLISYFLLQSRKKDVDVCWTSQFFNQIDIRLRNLTDCLTECRMIKFCKCKKDCGHIKVEENTHHIRTSSGEKIIKERFIANQFYRLYNTYEVVKNILVKSIK